MPQQAPPARQRKNATLRRGVALAAAALTGFAVPVLPSAPARADTAPVPPVTVPTVSADALPTVQINGVAWAQIVVGNRVYVTGNFSQARPAGAAAGTNQTARSNLLAYDLSTGNLITSWAPTLNAQGLALAASQDGSRIYVAGDFTSVNGVARTRIAALDATTGALITGFNASANARVRTLAVRGGTLYAGGGFTSASGQPRQRLAAFDGTTGAILAWAPTADQQVWALTAPPGSGQIIAGGSFVTVNDASVIGMGALDAATGANLPWAANSIIKNYGADAAIYSLSSDANQVYGTGYGYLVNNDPTTDANLENVFAATVNGGSLVWVSGCLGDTYSSVPLAGVVYSVGHAHNCGMIGGHPQTEPWTFQRAMAYTTTPGAHGEVNRGGAFNGRPAPELLHWQPTVSLGSFTGQYQGAWHVTGAGKYVVMGGEFPSVNGVAQQGLTRFAVRDIAPNTQGPQDWNGIAPTPLALEPGTVRLSWTASWDRDNRQLTYEVLRGAQVGSSTVLATRTLDSAWWARPPMAFTDRTAPPGSSQTYRIRVRDPLGNTLVSASRTIAVPDGTAQASPYSDALAGDAVTNHWRLGEDSGTVGYDWASGNDLTLASDVQHGVAGALTGDANKASGFPGTAGSVPATTTRSIDGPQTFSVEAWFSTTSTSGGKLIGFGNRSSGDSSNYDRHLYLTNAGKLVFGVYDNAVRAVTSPSSYNDGAWHHVVGTLGANGQQLYVDGKKVAGRTDSTAAQAFAGYWRIGGDNLNGWPDRPSSFRFTGSLDEVATYSTALDLSQVRAHYVAAGRDLVIPQRPGDGYGAAVWDSQPDLFLRLDEPSGTTAIDTMTAEAGATYSAGIQLGQPGSPPAATGKSITFASGANTVVATGQSNNPQVFSLETWFRTTTTSGGRIIGFGNAQNGNSSNYDRHLYMLDSGQLRYGIWTGQASVIDSPAGYNDGAWHHVVVTQGPSGQQLYVDGKLVATGSATTPQGYNGYWRLGSDNTWGGASTNNFAGSLDEAAVYPSVLSAATVQAHYAFGAPAAPNQPPTAAFTSSTNNLTAAFDAGGSTDADGSIASYAWDFGDGATGTGATPSHPYAAAGTYTVTLTVTDDKGATGTVTHAVTVAPAPNQAPVAAFTSNCTTLSCTFDGSGSADADGTVASYAWDFGDGATGTGATPSHPYAAAGTYTVTLTVTDDDGSTGVVTHDVTVTAAPPALATDAFGRTVTGGLGTADSGGTWTLVGNGSNVNVTGGVAAIRMPTAGSGPSAYLGSVSSSSTDLSVTVTTDKVGTGNGIYLSAIGRRTAGGDYRGRIRLLSGNAIAIGVTRVVGGAETVIGSEVTLPGVTYTPGLQLKIRLQVEGTGTTDLRLKVWPATASEPAAWQVTRTDTTAALQTAGGIGLATYLSGSSNNSPVIASWDDLVATGI